MTKSPVLRILDDEKLRAIRIQAELVREGEFFLAGGTGLGLHLGHRCSRDLDWFTARDFDATELKQKLENLREKPTKLEQHGRRTLRAYYGELETSFILYQQVKGHPQPFKVAGTEIPVADVELLAAMKAGAVHGRGSRRDFIDIHAISGQPGWSVGRFIEQAAKKLPLRSEEVARALTYFADAEREPMPEGYVGSWEKVKRDLSAGVRQWERTRDIER